MVNPDIQPQSAPLWTVGVPRQTKVADQVRGYIDAWDVPVIMADKSTFTVTIPATDFTPDNVENVIKDHVDRVVAIRSLQGPTY
jgi:hypothetical protein